MRNNTERVNPTPLPIVNSVITTNVTHVAVSQYTTFLIAAGALYYAGLFGNSSLVPAPLAVFPITFFVSVSTSSIHAAALSSKNQVLSYCAGPEVTSDSHKCNSNVLGRQMQPAYIPTPITYSNGTVFALHITKVSAGHQYTLLLSEDGTVFSYGENKYGALGQGDTLIVTNPTPIKTSKYTTGKKFSSIHAGVNSAMLLATDGTLYGMGLNSCGQLGDGTEDDRYLATRVVDKYNVLQGKVIIEISTADTHTLLLASNGQVFGFGDGEILKGEAKHNFWNPIAISVDEPIKSISCGMIHSLLLSRSGNLYTFGNNKDGELGDGTTTPHFQPTKINISDVDLISYGSAYYSVAQFTLQCFGKAQDVACSYPNGTCLSRDKCECKDFYYGKQCEMYTCYGQSYDSQYACAGNGYCIAPDRCACKPNYIGERCQLFTCDDIANNDTRVCSGRGTCIGFDQCVCARGYKTYTKNCDTIMCARYDKNDPRVCCGRGQCVEPEHCHCNEGYGENFCEAYYCRKYLS
jgi:alpha-tubulin suppressor-like RCC1 family protein